MAGLGVLLLDDDEDLLEALGEAVTSLCGRPCLQLRSVADLVENLAQAQQCALAILDVHLGVGKPSGLDAYALLQAGSFAGRIVFITGHAADHPLVRQAHAVDGAKVLRKPFDFGDLHALIEWTESAA